MLLGDSAVVLVGTIYPDLRVAFWILAPDEDVVAALGPEVDALITVGRVMPLVLVVDLGGAGTMCTSCLRCAGADVHCLLDVRHPVDDERVRTGDVDDDGGIDLLAVLERDALHTPVATDGDDLAAEQELAAVHLRRALEVVRGELRVVHVPGSGVKMAPGSCSSGVCQKTSSSGRRGGQNAWRS